MFTHRELYIRGQWTPPAAPGIIDVLSASTEEVIGSVPQGTPIDVDEAVRAARAAFDNGWSETTAAERADWLTRLAGALKDRGERIANIIAQEVGSPLSMATSIQAGLPVLVTSTYAQMMGRMKLQQ